MVLLFLVYLSSHKLDSFLNPSSSRLPGRYFRKLENLCAAVVVSRCLQAILKEPFSLDEYCSADVNDAQVQIPYLTAAISNKDEAMCRLLLDAGCPMSMTIQKVKELTTEAMQTVDERFLGKDYPKKGLGEQYWTPSGPLQGCDHGMGDPSYALVDPLSKLMEIFSADETQGGGGSIDLVGAFAFSPRIRLTMAHRLQLFNKAAAVLADTNQRRRQVS